MLDLSLVPQVKGARHWSVDIDQTCHPTVLLGEEIADIVYARDTVNVTKFIPILVKEWMYLLKKDGFLILDYKANQICDGEILEKWMWSLWKGKYEIVYHDSISLDKASDLSEEKLREFLHLTEPQKDVFDGKGVLGIKGNAGETEIPYFRFICKKTSSTLNSSDSIKKWTVGIVTNGKRPTWVRELVESVKRQNIPEYEILIVGSHVDINSDNVKFFPFTVRDNGKGWITRKKNMIIENAKYENLLILHDRMILGDGWFAGMERWGNCFEALAVPQVVQATGERFGDWHCTVNFRREKRDSLGVIGGKMDYRDWDRDIPSYAAVTIAKRRLLEAVRFDETLYWGEYDDLVLHQDMTQHGVVLRFNADATIFTQTKSTTALDWYFEYNLLKRGRLRGESLLALVGLKALAMIGIDKTSSVLNPIRSYLRFRQNIRTHKDGEPHK